MKSWNISTHLRILSKCYPMNTNMTGTCMTCIWFLSRRKKLYLYKLNWKDSTDYLCFQFVSLLKKQELKVQASVNSSSSLNLQHVLPDRAHLSNGDFYLSILLIVLQTCSWWLKYLWYHFLHNILCFIFRVWCYFFKRQPEGCNFILLIYRPLAWFDY